MFAAHIAFSLFIQKSELYSILKPIPPTNDTGGFAMNKRMVLECPTGYEIVCEKDSEQERHQCCCCARPGSLMCETDPYIESSN